MKQNFNLVGTEVEMKNGDVERIDFVKGDSLDDMNIYLSNGKGFSLATSVGKGFIKLKDNELNNKVLSVYQEKEMENNKAKHPFDYSDLDIKIVLRKREEEKEKELERLNTVYTSDPEYKCLSNMYRCEVEYKGVKYKSSETAYQAQKDPDLVEKFVDLTGYQAMIKGKKVDPIKYFNENEFQIMKEILICKFNQHPELKELLLNTGTKKIVVVSKQDTYWGMNGKTGYNYLGKMLMKLRKELA